ncbi:hypothetical protein G4Y79_03355 [Phototrophicus methaneseepsis]|uniref:DUF883 domain-containing protein n=1 Tax=Phototrophicus methaneseepsis TaxID=2710758 RepID=A0A7S8EAK7_9CHLR|nr:hypothetical protein [Phototrophicus methaneseepsis]QPC83433.1 hypothetical protein G4Y79_03355 [Phototrophicus methaneseepsis]
MSDDNGVANGASAQEAQERLEDMGKEIGKRLSEGAEVARSTIAKRISEAATTIRGEIDEHDELDDETRTRAKKVVDGLDNAAKYLESNSLDAIEDDARAAVVENPWRAIVIAFVLGLIVGWLLKD